MKRYKLCKSNCVLKIMYICHSSYIALLQSSLCINFKLIELIKEWIRALNFHLRLRDSHSRGCGHSGKMQECCLSQTDSCQGKRTLIPKPLNGKSEESEFGGSVNSEGGEENGGYQWGGDQQ